MPKLYLEDVNITGFKSFSEKTTMSFKPGIGVIVGNNGVGKSNILDAIVWALGENDLERIRCYEHDELFFAGSRDYSPASGIRVELILQHGEGKNAPAISLVREHSKDGTDQYWISEKRYDRKTYRLKLEEFNLRHALKTIVRQEQINDILLLNPFRRFETVQLLLGAESETKTAGCLQDTVNPCLRRYMSYLIPQGRVRLDIISNNGRKVLSEMYMI